MFNPIIFAAIGAVIGAAVKRLRSHDPYKNIDKNEAVKLMLSR